MVVQPIEPRDVVRLVRHTLALPETAELRDEALLGAVVRRTAGILCPCSETTLTRSILESFSRLEDGDELKADVESAVQNAMIAGDLLELSQATTDDPDVKGTWVFAAPPAFVSRPSGAFFMGIVPDEPSPLPRSLTARIIYQRQYRFIRSEPGEDLARILRELGVLELSEQSWLKVPKEETAQNFRGRLEQELMRQGPSGEVPDLLVLDSAIDPGHYRGRWTTAKKHTGSFVARRPQAYGAALWGFAHLAEGVLNKFLDFPLKRDRWRGSDFAWHLQMAIDACRHVPQKYRRRPTPTGACLDFFSPIPLWAERRLAIVGLPAPKQNCLFSYHLPAAELSAEEQFLQKRLWLAPIESS